MAVNIDLIAKIKKNTVSKHVSVLSETSFFDPAEDIPTSVPILNIALSGRVDGGFSPGLVMWAGESKRFKTSFSLLMAKSFMDKYDNGILIFYDTEFGSPPAFFDTFGIDKERVVHIPIMDIEELKFDMVKQLTQLNKDEHVMIIIDSLGNVASKKEVQDALKENTVADMTRAKAIKSLFRMVTPYLEVKKIPLVVINHIYKSMGMFASDIVSGGSGSIYGANSVFIVGRQQEKEKEGSEIAGYHFIIKVEKSRFVKERRSLSITVKYDKGIDRYSGLMAIALESGHVKSPTTGWYQKKGDTNKLRLKATNTKEFWDPILNDESFKKFVSDKYVLTSPSIIEYDEKIEDDEVVYEQD